MKLTKVKNGVAGKTEILTVEEYHAKYHGKKAKNEPIKILVRKLDSVFSQWIRRRDSENEFGIIQCVTCGKPMDIKTAQCGHFISRRHYATRWEEKNCAAQCVGCNLFNQGKQYEFGLAINKRFGSGTTDKLLIQSKNKFSLNRTVLELLISKYKQ